MITNDSGAAVASATRFTTDGLKYYTVLEVPGSGQYTLTVSYSSGKVLSEVITVAAPEPIIGSNGRVFTVEGFAAGSVSYMRLAKGVFTTASAMKSAPDLRTYASKYFRENTAAFAALDAVSGETTTYTAQIMFRSGYTVFVTFEVTPTVPVVTVENGAIVIDNAAVGASYMQWVRYAKGDLATLTQIRKAAGSRIVTSSAIKDGAVTITGLTPGTYSLYYLYDDYDLSEGLIKVTVN